LEKVINFEKTRVHPGRVHPGYAYVHSCNLQVSDKVRQQYHAAGRKAYNKLIRRWDSERERPWTS